MIMRSALTPALLAALLVSAAPVLAAQPAQVAAADQEIKTTTPSKAELKTFDQVKIPIATAIAAANKHSSGKVIDASFDAGSGKPVYNVKTHQNNSVWEGAVDAQSGQI